MVSTANFGVLAVGNSIPITQVREDVAAAYKKDVEWQTTERMLPFRKIITQKKVSAHGSFQTFFVMQTVMIKHLILLSSVKQMQADLVIIESDDIAKAIAEEVTRSTINKLVIGAASRGIFTR